MIHLGIRFHTRPKMISSNIGRYLFFLGPTEVHVFCAMFVCSCARDTCASVHHIPLYRLLPALHFQFCLLCVWECVLVCV